MAEQTSTSESITSPGPWEEQMLNSIQTLRSSTPPDCHVIVNSEHIPAHRTVLLLNSTLTAGDTATYNKESGMFEVTLAPGFGDQVQLVGTILGSFYTGVLQLEQQDLEVVYKFAKTYSVSWLQQSVGKRFIEYITSQPGCERFVEIFKFAHTVWCSHLMDVCVSTLDDSMMMDLLSKPSIILQLDFFCMRSISTSSKLCIEEKWVFKLVNRWFKELKQRDHLDNCHLGYLLTSVQYHLIDIPYLQEVVFDFVLDSTSLEDGVRRMLLKKIRDAMKHTDGENDRTRNKKIGAGETSVTSLDTSSAAKEDSPKQQTKRPIRPDNLVRKIVGIMGGSIPESDKSITSNEIDLLLSEKFQDMEHNIQELVVDYLASRDHISSSNCTQCLQLYDVTTNNKLLLLVVNYLTRDPRDYNEIYNIRWEEVSFDTIRTMIHDTAISDIFYQVL